MDDVNLVSSQHLINVTDFSAHGNNAADNHINPNLLSHTALDPQSNGYLGNYSSITS